MKNRLAYGSMVRWAVPAACLAFGLACAQADVDDTGKGGNGASNGTGANNGTGATGGFSLGGFPGTLMGAPIEGGQGCNDTSVKFERTIPTVALVIDRSSSMTTAYGTGNRWDVLKQVLLNPDPKMGVLKALEGEIRFGLAMYTSVLSEPTCPMLGTVDFALGNFEAINAVYGPAATPSDKGETPTAETIRAVTEKLLANKEPGAKYILLATDGEPDGCGPVRDPNCGQDESVAAVADAYSKGIKTFVIAIGNEVGQDHLQALANVGQGLQPILGQMKYDWLRYSCNIAPANLKGKYADLVKDPNSQELRVMAPVQTPANATAYRPDDPAALALDLQKVIGTVRDCKFRLQGEVEMNRGPEGFVAIDGMPVTYNDPNGWKLNSATEVELIGAACAKVQSDDSKGVFISFPCGVFAPD